VQALDEPGALVEGEVGPGVGAGAKIRDGGVQRFLKGRGERVDAWVGAQRELLSNLLQANLTQVSVRQNEDMRKISAWVAILAIPTMIAGIYGMNFEHMPELKWEWGYPLVIGVMVAITIAMLGFFKRKKWI